MKKLSFVFALVFAASFVMAQHVSTVTETGAGNNVTVAQSFSGSGTSFQGNVSDVQLTGNLNKAIVNQVNNGYGGQAMTSEIIAVGNSNLATVNQNLEGEGDAIITQTGDNNIGHIFESGNFGASIPIDGPYDANITQLGNSNTADMAIWGVDATAYAYQNGNNNSIAQNIGSGVGDKDQNSNLWSKQYGNGNISKQTITGNGFAGGITTAWNEGRIMQAGNNNYAEQLMDQNGLDLSSPTNDLEGLEQYGNSNWSKQVQKGQLDYSYVLQGKNTLMGGNTSTTTQIGNSNFVSVVQN